MNEELLCQVFRVKLLETCKFFSHMITLVFMIQSLLKLCNLRKFYNKERSKFYTILWSL